MEVPNAGGGNRRQLELIQRYARILRQQTALHRGPRIGARERRLAREAAARFTRPTKSPAG